MKFSTKEKRFWKTKFSFNGVKNIPNEIDHLKLRDEYFTNEELYYITARINKIEKLDLDNNPIDDDGIPFLTNLNGLKELRLKSLDLTDKCVEDLCKLINVEFLHLGGTAISCDGILKLSVLPNLKTLLASPEIIEKEKLDKFLLNKPNCELTIHNKPYPESLI